MRFFVAIGAFFLCCHNASPFGIRGASNESHAQIIRDPKQFPPAPPIFEQPKATKPKEVPSNEERAPVPKPPVPSAPISKEVNIPQPNTQLPEGNPQTPPTQAPTQTPQKDPPSINPPVTSPVAPESPALPPPSKEMFSDYAKIFESLEPHQSYPFLFVVFSTNCSERNQVRAEIQRAKNVGDDIQSYEPASGCSGTYLANISSWQDVILVRQRADTLPKTTVQAFPFTNAKVRSFINLFYTNGHVFSRWIYETAPFEVGGRIKSLALNSPSQFGFPIQCATTVTSQCLYELNTFLNYSTTDDVGNTSTLRDILRGAFLYSGRIRAGEVGLLKRLKNYSGFFADPVISKVTISHEVIVQGPSVNSADAQGVPAELKASDDKNLWLIAPIGIPASESEDLSSLSDTIYACKLRAFAEAL